MSGGMLESSYNVKSFVSITSSGHGRPCHHNRFLMLISWLSPGDSAWGPRVSGSGWQAGVPAAPQVFCSSLYIPFTSNTSFSFSFWAPLSSLSFSLNSLFWLFILMKCHVNLIPGRQHNLFAAYLWTEITAVQWPSSDLNGAMSSLIVMHFYYLHSDLWSEVSSKVCPCSYSGWICHRNCNLNQGVGGLVLFQPWWKSVHTRISQSEGCLDANVAVFLYLVEQRNKALRKNKTWSTDLAFTSSSLVS